MISPGRIARQSLLLLSGRLAAQGLALVLTVILAARLGPAGLGGYAVVAAVVYIANVATTFGTDMVVTREIASGERADGWLAALAVQVVLSAAAVGVIWIVAALAAGSGTAPALRVYSLSLFPAALFSVSVAALRGAGRMGNVASVGILAAGLQVAAAWVLVAAGGSLLAAVLALLIAQSVAAAAAWCAAAASRVVPLTGLPEREDVVDMARRGAAIGVLGWLGVVYQRLGVLALSVFAGPVATGWFSSASRLVEGSKTGHVAVFGALYPAMAVVHADADRDPVEDPILRVGLGLTAGFAIVIAAALVVLGPLAVRILYGPGFAPASAAVAVLGLSVVPSTLATYQSLELVASHREAVALRALLVSLGVLVALTAGLIPLVGWLGACWAIVAAESVQAIALWFARREPARPRPIPRARPLVRRPFVDGVP